MMKIQILGAGCQKCKRLYENTITAVGELGLSDCEIEKIEDITEIMKFGVMGTPALVVDGDVKKVGKVLTVAQIKEILGG